MKGIFFYNECKVFFSTKLEEVTSSPDVSLKASSCYIGQVTAAVSLSTSSTASHESSQQRRVEPAHCGQRLLLVDGITMEPSKALQSRRPDPSHGEIGHI